MRDGPRLIDQRRRYGLILSNLRPPPARVLEVGVGGGWLLRYLSAAGYVVFGCDTSLSAFTDEEKERLNLTLSSINGTLNFPDDSFDVVISCDVLEHVLPQHRSNFLCELERVTKPHGTLLLTAFFRNTRLFSLWGASMLATQRSLPAWFLEHLTIPLPVEEDVQEFFAEKFAKFDHQRYQRSLNLLICILQCFPDRLALLRRIGDALARRIYGFDVVGQPTSSFFAGVKAAPLVP